MRTLQTAAVAALLATGLGWMSASAQDQETDVKALLQRIEELEQKVRIMDRKNELGAEAVAEKSKTTPTVALGAGGFSVTSAN